MKFSNAQDLKVWLKDRPPEFGCALAARIALRLAPVLRIALRADSAARRSSIVLPGFRALAVVSFAGAWPGRVDGVRDAARSGAQAIVNAVSERVNAARKEIAEFAEAYPDDYGWPTEAKADKDAFAEVSRAVNAIAYGIQAALDMVDANRGVASFDAVKEAATSAAEAAYFAIDQVNEHRAFGDALSDEWTEFAARAPHITQFWESVALDANHLETNIAAESDVGMVLEGLFKTPLWPNGIPVWASRQWANFKDELPTDEGWTVWIEWYESHLTGRGVNEALERVSTTISKDDWTQGARHVNRLIAKGIGAPASGWYEKKPEWTGRKTYQVALSFAGEQRDYVEEIARHLASRSIDVFYDGFESARLWGKDLVEELHGAFAEQSVCVVMFISEAYARKMWPRHERRSALSRMIQEDKEYVLPVRFDDTPIPGLPESIFYLRAEEHSPAELAAIVAEKLGVSPFEGKASDVPPPRMTSLVGEAVFDYSDFNGRYVIGSGMMEFETKWSKASDQRIRIYNDPDSIHGVALGQGFDSIADIRDAEQLNYTSGMRAPAVGEVVVLQNRNRFYAAIQLVKIKDNTRDDDNDELRFRYAIQNDGTGNFTEFRNMLS